MPDTFKIKKDPQPTSSRALFELLASPGPQDLERVRELLELGANPNELYYDIDKRGTNAIALAIQSANSELIKLVVSSPQANPQLVQLFLDKAAEKFISREISHKGVGKKGIGYIQWDRSYRAHMLAIVRSIAATMAAVTELPQFRIPYAAKNSLLGWAVTENNIEWVEKALKMGANPNSPYDTFIESFTKPSPFQMTLKQSNQAMTSLLLKYGANPYGESNRHIRVLLKKKIIF